VSRWPTASGSPRACRCSRAACAACLPDAAPGLKAIARDGLEWFEGEFKGPWIAGDRFTLADILLFAFLDFGGQVGQPLDPAFAKLTDWFARVKARPSAAASA
jgi:glutathione S-transferase